ncbi:MAG TPA: ATP-binding cassette domain-containing protein [Gemmatimonadaceae bacterium]|nr:ATP-binding cassette domain-containing protein [Gemmatimonadaceae bacterium]
MNPMLHADSLTWTHRSQRVLTSATLRVWPGKIVAIVGRVGAGKSTLLKICAGLLASDSGWVRLNGELFTQPRLSQLAGKGLFYLRDRQNLVPRLSLQAHFDAIQYRFGAGDTQGAVASLRLSDLLHRPTRTYSGGESRRAELALALVRNPLCLIVDEVFRGIDPIAVEMIGESLQTLARRGCAIVVSGHEMRAILPYADTVTWVTAGTTYDLGIPSEALKIENFRREYLGDAGGDDNRARV